MCRFCDGFAAARRNRNGNCVALRTLDKRRALSHITRTDAGEDGVSATLLFLAMLLDAALGEPRWLWSRAPHPAVLMGRAVGWADKTLNKGEPRRVKGAVAMAGLAVMALAIGWVIHIVPDFGVLEIVAVAIILAQRSLADHVRAVADALRLSVRDGRMAVAMIVGRDTATMTEADVARGAIESAAENLSDGVVAPIFWYLILGLPGLMFYKITNTADSMIGHRTPRYAEFGWAAARLDDVLNWVPARITAVLIALAHGWTDPAPILRDGPLHRSPNAGWPEAAMAVVLDVALSGPRSYHGQITAYPWVNPDGARQIGAAEVDRSVAALWRAWLLTLVIVGIMALF
jgi:adenosylcobinamide-phosphate synthase